MKKYFYFVLVFLLIIFSFSYFRSEKAIDFSDIKYVEIRGAKPKVELALGDESRARGLSGRAELKENEGMLFVFDTPSKYSFWMKDMNFPIDIIWISGDMKVVYIKQNATPESYPEIFTPPVDAKYVLEVVANFAEKYTLEVGDEIEFSK